MTSIDEHDTERAPVLDEAALNAARRTVAAHALDAADCGELLDMLGLRGLRGEPACAAQPVEEKREEENLKPRPVPAPKCACGHLAVGGEQCGRCAHFVPRDDFRALVSRIKDATDMSVADIAKAAGMLPSTLRGHLAPGNRGRVERGTYGALLRVAEAKGVA